MGGGIEEKANEGKGEREGERTYSRFDASSPVTSEHVFSPYLVSENEKVKNKKQRREKKTIPIDDQQVH